MLQLNVTMLKTNNTCHFTVLSKAFNEADYKNFVARKNETKLVYILTQIWAEYFN